MALITFDDLRATIGEPDWSDAFRAGQHYFDRVSEHYRKSPDDLDTFSSLLASFNKKRLDQTQLYILVYALFLATDALDLFPGFRRFIGGFEKAELEWLHEDIRNARSNVARWNWICKQAGLEPNVSGQDEPGVKTMSTWRFNWKRDSETRRLFDNEEGQLPGGMKSSVGSDHGALHQHAFTVPAASATRLQMDGACDTPSPCQPKYHNSDKSPVQGALSFKTTGPELKADEEEQNSNPASPFSIKLNSTKSTTKLILKQEVTAIENADIDFQALIVALGKLGDDSSLLAAMSTIGVHNSQDMNVISLFPDIHNIRTPSFSPLTEPTRSRGGSEVSSTLSSVPDELDTPPVFTTSRLDDDVMDIDGSSTRSATISPVTVVMRRSARNAGSRTTNDSLGLDTSTYSSAYSSASNERANTSEVAASNAHSTLSTSPENPSATPRRIVQLKVPGGRKALDSLAAAATIPPSPSSPAKLALSGAGKKKRKVQRRKGW